MKADSSRFWFGAGYGLVATLAMSVVMMLVWALGRDLMPEPLPVSLLVRLIGRGLGVQHVVPAILLAIPIHFLYGAWWAGLVTASTERVTWWKGLALGLGLWLIMLVYLLPFAGNKVFSEATSATMWIGSLAMHLVYGLTFGALVQRHEPLRGYHPDHVHHAGPTRLRLVRWIRS